MTAAAAKKPFKRAYIEISNRCNLRCDFCPPLQRPPQTMSAAQFATLVADVAPLVEELYLHLMGEPLLHPELDQILALTQSHGLRVNLVTNGTLLTEERRQLALHAVVRQVNISLHSFGGGAGSVADLDAYLAPIFTFARQAMRVRPDLYLNLRLWNLASPHAQHLSQEDAMQLALHQRIAAEFGVSLQDQEIHVRRRKQVRLGGRHFLHFDTRFTWPSLALEERASRGTCHGMRNHFGILADGRVVPCCLDKEGVIELGSAGNTPLAQILASSRAKSIRDGFARGELVEPLCRRCPFIARFDSTPQKIKNTKK